MAVTVNDIGSALMETFQLKLVAGAHEIDHVVTWVHMMEDTSVMDFFWGNEMIVTSCYTIQNTEELIQLMDAIANKRSAGVVINVGKYINQVPKTVIDHCNEIGLPLYTMPWHMSMTEFVRSACTFLTQNVQIEESLSKAVMRAVNAPYDPGAYLSELSSYFDEAQGFQFLSVRIKASQNMLTNTQELIIDQRSALRLHTAIQHFGVRYLIFKDNQRIFILLNTSEAQTARQAAETILKRIRERMPDVLVQIGIGDWQSSFEYLANAYHSALSAQRCARVQNLDIVEFSNMSFYRLLYAIPDDNLLKSYYQDAMNPLIEYDQHHNTNLAETLFRYLLADGSLNEVAAQMFTHRNTINYRMGKIRELLGCELNSSHDKLTYLLAYHAGLVLKLVKPLD